MSNKENIVGDTGMKPHDSKIGCSPDDPTRVKTPKNKVAAIRVSKNFNYGSYYLDPNLQCKAQHALYEPITDRFIFCGSNYRLLQQLLVVFSSRYPLLRLIRLDLAENFRPNLIDNSCIYGWTFKDVTGFGDDDKWKSVVFSAEMTILSQLLIPAKTLIPCDPAEVQDELYVRDMHYMQSIYSIFENIQAGLNNTPLGSATNLMDVSLGYYVNARKVPFNTNDDNSTVTTELYNFLMGVSDIAYTEFDFDTAKQKILKFKRTFVR